MVTGEGPNGSVHASLSDRDALKLWDAIVGSIRIRPTTKTTAASGNGAPGTAPE